MGGYNPGRGFEEGSPFDQLRGGGRRHKGVDFPAAAGTPIPAAADGVVVGRGWNDDYGNVAMIQHVDPASANVKLTLYAHMPNVDSTPALGSRVTKGQSIGVVGNTGRSFGAHLHFELISLPAADVPWTERNPWSGGATGIAGSTGRIDPLNDQNWGGIDVYRGEAAVSSARPGTPAVAMCCVDPEGSVA